MATSVAGGMIIALNKPKPVADAYDRESLLQKYNISVDSEPEVKLNNTTISNKGKLSQDSKSVEVK